MKVRQRLFPNEVFEVLAESANHYILKGPAMSLAGAWTSDGELFAPKTMWEPVPEPDRWQDVTGECVEHINQDDGGHFLRYNERTLASMPDDYRLRKVQMWVKGVPIVTVEDYERNIKTEDQWVFDGHVFYRKWAFLVERKVD